MSKFLLVIFILCNSLLAYANIDATTLLNPQQQLSTWQQTYGVSAISLSIDNAEGNISTWTLGIREQGTKQAITPKSLFRMNSVTKSFTAALCLKLAEQGKLNLDAPITQYLPQYSTWQSVTIRELLNQTSGINDYTDSPDWFKNLAMQPHKVWTPAMLVSLVYLDKFSFPPGQGWAYSNTNYVLLGMIIEKITGKSMQTNLQQVFFTPLHLDDTYYVTYPMSKQIQAKLVHGYFKNQDVTLENPSVWQAAAGIVSTTHDMALWFHDLMTGKVLSPNNQRLMTTWFSTTHGQPTKSQPSAMMAYGMGVFYDRAFSAIFVPGISSGYRSLVVYIPTTKTTYAVALNNGLPNQPQWVSYMLKCLSKRDVNEALALNS